MSDKAVTSEPLIPKQGGYRKLKSFQVAQLVYDTTARFCDRYIEKRSRTHDQMVQAARSGVQNIAEGSQASGTSKKFELKLTNVARASLEELRLDYEDFLRQRNLPLWEHGDLRRQSLIDRRCNTADEVAAWLREEHDRGLGGQSGPGGLSGQAVGLPATYPELAANAALVLLAVACACLIDNSLLRQRLLQPRAVLANDSTGFALKNALPSLPRPPRPLCPASQQKQRSPR